MSTHWAPLPSWPCAKQHVGERERGAGLRCRVGIRQRRVRSRLDVSGVMRDGLGGAPPRGLEDSGLGASLGRGLQGGYEDHVTHSSAAQSGGLLL